MKGVRAANMLKQNAKLLAIIAAAILMFAGAGWWGWAGRRGDGQTSQAPAPKRYWIITQAALRELTADRRARDTLASDVIYSPGFNPMSATVGEEGLQIVPTVSFASEAGLEAAIAGRGVPPYVKAILYDNEPWSLTPRAEQQDPVLYYQRAAAAAHAHGYALIATPVPNSIAPLAARDADVVDVQAQFAQSSPSAYLAAAQNTIRRVAAANPHAIILSGLSTNPPAGDPSVQQLVAIAKATYPALVRGWWLNVPAPGAACPKCQQPRPDLGIKFLQQLTY